MTIATDNEYKTALAEAKHIMNQLPNDDAWDQLCALAMDVLIYETENGINDELQS